MSLWKFVICVSLSLWYLTRSLTCTGTRGNLLCSPLLRWTETFTSGTSGQNFRRKKSEKTSIHFPIREPRKPSQSFQTIVGASHIRWSRGDCNYLARYLHCCCCRWILFLFYFYLGGGRNTGWILGVLHIQWKQQLFKSVHSLLSAHDGDVKLWDSRNDSAPLTYLSAHLSRVPFNWFWGKLE